jgi:hypothetical protein
MFSIKDDDTVQALASDRTHDPLCQGGRDSGRGDDFLNTK